MVLHVRNLVIGPAHAHSAKRRAAAAASGAATSGAAAPIAPNAIVKGVSLDVAPGERVGLVGPSGSGKSMISRAILGILPASLESSGSIKLGGTEVIGAPDAQLADLRGRFVSAVFQNPGSALDPVHTIAHTIGLPLTLHYDVNRDEVHDRVLAQMDAVDLPRSLAGAYPYELSGGQRQRVAIAAALITSPRLIIADEPTTALDAVVQRDVVDLLVRLVDGLGASLLFITHDFVVLRRATTRCYVMEHGTIAESGETEALMRTPQTEIGKALVNAAEQLTLHGGAESGDAEGEVNHE